jgi:dipeptidyl aminopeptidase/acylaminoacyl peptidase
LSITKMNRQSFIMLLSLLTCSAQVIERAEYVASPFFPSIAYLQQEPPQRPQQKRLTLAEVEAAVEKDGCFAFKETGAFPASTVCKYDFKLNSKNVEAITVRPLGDGPFPGIILLPGYEGRAIHLTQIGRSLAKEGYVCMAMTPPGFGKSDGKRDFVGPETIETFITGYRKFQSEPFVDAKRMGIYGYSRGGMAAALMAVQLDDLKAAVFGGGIYDFQRAYDETKLDGIRENMRKESGWTPQAIEQRSAILKIQKLRAAVLILHGEKDVNAPASQAYLLRDRLTELKKDFEIKLYPERAHGLDYSEVVNPMVDFFKRKIR